MLYKRLKYSNTVDDIIKRLESFFDVNLESVITDSNGYMVLGVEGFDNKNLVERKLQNLGVQYMLDAVDPEDPEYFIFRINDSRFS